MCLPLSRDTGLRLTVARYHLPSGRSVQEGGIKPDIHVPQISDPDYKKRIAMRESDLRRHLVNELADEDKELEDDIADDPRFAMTTEQLKAKGYQGLPIALRDGNAGPLGHQNDEAGRKAGKG